MPRKTGPKSQAEKEMADFLDGDNASRLSALRNAIHVDIPPELESEIERERYRTFFLDNPSSHAMTETVTPLLVQLVWEKTNANYLKQRIEELKLDPAKDDEVLKFMKAFATSSASMMSILTKLRATPSATHGYRSGPKTVKVKEMPWEFGMTPAEIAESRRLRVEQNLD